MPSESNFDIGANDSVRQMIQQFERKNSKPLQLGSNPNPLAVRKSSRGNRNDFQAMRMTEVKAQELTTAGPIDFSRYSVGNSSNSSSEGSNTATTDSSLTMPEFDTKRTAGYQNIPEDTISIEFREVDQLPTSSPFIPPVPQNHYYSTPTPVKKPEPSYNNNNSINFRTAFDPEDLYKPSKTLSKATVLTEDTDHTSLSSISSLEDEGPEEVVVEVEVKKPGRKKSIRWADNLEVFQEIPVVVEHEDNYFKGNKVQFDELANLQKEPEEEKEDSPQINKSKIQKKKSFWSKLSCVSSDIIDDVMN
mmetsp:Transcript_5735/g.6257  ORF Transcript_5735/g.6257 Transcript_5735/m.6257 type:complete len:305 (+) Transcript_5735:50-964(+)